MGYMEDMKYISVIGNPLQILHVESQITQQTTAHIFPVAVLAAARCCFGLYVSSIAISFNLPITAHSIKCFFIFIKIPYRIIQLQLHHSSPLFFLHTVHSFHLFPFCRLLFSFLFLSLWSAAIDLVCLLGWGRTVCAHMRFTECSKPLFQISSNKSEPSLVFIQLAFHSYFACIYTTLPLYVYAYTEDISSHISVLIM